MVCLEWGNLTSVNNLYFQNIILSNILIIDLDLYPKINNGYFVAYFDQVCSWNLV